MSMSIDEYYDCYICPNNQFLHYAATNRDGYWEYGGCGAVCAGCPYLAQCANSKEHVKTVTRHVWAADLEKVGGEPLYLRHTRIL